MINFWSFFLKKTQFSILFTVALAVFGITSLLQMPKESNPTVDFPMAIVLTTLPGASAIDIEKLVTNTLEDPLNKNLENVKKITSQSSQNISSIRVEFIASADINDSIAALKDEVDSAKSDLPADATDPKVIKIDISKEPVLSFAIAADVPRGILLDLSKKLETQLEKTSGVASVSITGVQEREVQVLVQKEALSKYNILIPDIARAISAQNIALPGGSLIIDNTSYPVRFNGDITEPIEIANLPIAVKGGTPILLKDVATIIDGFSEPVFLSRLSVLGSPSRNSFTVDVFKKPSSKLTTTGVSVKDALKELQKDGALLDGVSVSITFDRAEMLSSDLKTLSMSGLTTVLLVMSILFFAIGWREALVAGLAIPLSFLIAFIGLKSSGNSLNFISLFALILSTGIIVDSAIVVVEGINAHMKDAQAKDQSKMVAAFAAVHEYYAPLTSGTLTTIAVFAPLFTISGVTGQFIAAIPFTIIFVLLASLFVALAIVPIFATMILTRQEAHGKIAIKRERLLIKLRTYYANFLREFLLDNRNSKALNTILTILFIGALALPITGAVKTIFFPSENSQYVYIETELGNGTVLNNTDIEMRKIEEVIYETKDIKAFSSVTGKSSPFSHSLTGASNSTKVGNILMTVKEDSTRTSQEIMADLEQKLSIITSSDISVGQMQGGPPVGSPISLTFSGKSLTDLESTANKAAILLKSIPGTSNVLATTKDTAVELLIDINRSTAIKNGITPLSMAQNINIALSGSEATTLKRLGTDIPVTIRMDFSGNGTVASANKTTIDALRYMPISILQNGFESSQSLLGSFVDTKLTQSRTVIRHDDGDRIAIVSSDLSKGANAQIISTLFKEKAKSELQIPDGITMSLGGENEEVDQSFADMFTALAMGMTAMFAILVIQFNSFRQTLLVLLTVPLSLIGVFVGLLIMDQPLSFPAFMGFIALAGIVVNNGIILVDVINQRIEKEGLDLSKDTQQTAKLDFTTGKGSVATENLSEQLMEAIIASATSRLRPVLLTAITTVIGILPLVFAAEIWAPLAYSIIFGLTFATVLTLVLLPAMYYNKYSNRKKSIFKRIYVQIRVFIQIIFAR